MATQFDKQTKNKKVILMAEFAAGFTTEFATEFAAESVARWYISMYGVRNAVQQFKTSCWNNLAGLASLTSVDGAVPDAVETVLQTIIRIVENSTPCPGRRYEIWCQWRGIREVKDIVHPDQIEPLTYFEATDIAERLCRNDHFWHYYVRAIKSV